MLLNILLTRKCNYNCPHCIEKTKEDIKDNCSVESFLKKANYLIDNSIVNEVLLLGGEPFYYRGILEIIKGLHLKPIITTNAYPLLDKSFYNKINFHKIKAINISVPHYDYIKRKEIMGTLCLSNKELAEIVNRISIPVRMNTLLMKNYIGSKKEIYQMIKFAKEIGITSIKFGELTGITKSTHDFTDRVVLKYNQSQYCPIPFKSMYARCHKLGGSHFYRKVNGIDIFFNSAPDHALPGGRDSSGRYYHIVLFNDGVLGFSWRRYDGVYKNENEVLQLFRQNQLNV